MANLNPELTPEQEAAMDADLMQNWAAGRPQVIQDLCKRFKPWKLYRIKTTGDRGPLVSLNEAGTITLAVTGAYNLCSMERQVFGIKPDDLEECDLPAPDEVVGVYLTEREQWLMVNRRRAELGNPPMTWEEFTSYGPKGEAAGERLDRDVPPPDRAGN